MAQCPNCHSEIKAGERFCGNCGTRIEQSEQPPQAAAPAENAPPRLTGKETIVLPKITDLGLKPPETSPEPSPADATIIAAPSPAAAPPPAQPPSDATIIGGQPDLPPIQPTPPPIGGGAYTGPGLPSAPVMPQPQKSGSNIWKILAIVAGIGVLACVSLAIGGYLVFRRVSTSALATVSAGLETVVALPSLEPIATPAPASTLVSDDFEDPQGSDFTEGNNDSTTYKFVDGTYAITVKEPKLLSWAIIKGEYGNAAIAVEANIEGPAASAAGLIFHFKDNKNFYIYSVDGEGRYGLDVYKDDQLTTLIDWTESPAIKTAGQTNKLRVETSGDTIRLYANDELLDEISDDTIASGKAALVVNTFDDANVTVKFDNLVVQEVE